MQTPGANTRFWLLEPYFAHYEVAQLLANDLSFARDWMAEKAAEVSKFIDKDRFLIVAGKDTARFVDSYARNGGDESKLRAVNLTLEDLGEHDFTLDAGLYVFPDLSEFVGTAPQYDKQTVATIRGWLPYTGAAAVFGWPTSRRGAYGGRSWEKAGDIVLSAAELQPRPIVATDSETPSAAAKALITGAMIGGPCEKEKIVRAGKPLGLSRRTIERAAVGLVDSVRGNAIHGPAIWQPSEALFRALSGVAG